MSFLKRFFRRQSHRKEEQFRRFLRLNYQTYADMCVYGSDSGFIETHEGIASACRQWLPNLSNSTHRRVCRAIARVHETSAKRAESLDSLMTALDDLRQEAPSDLFGRSPSFINEVDAVLHDGNTGAPQLVDFKTATRVAKPNAQPGTPCSYCGKPDGSPAAFLSGEPASVCDSSECIATHDRLLRSEHEDFLRSGQIASTQIH
jgi:hypothetical protein